MSLIEYVGVSFAYDGKVVVDNLNYKIEKGDYLCIVGENGTGKSTLIKGLLNIKKPNSGRIILGEGLKHNEIGYLPQNTQAQRDFPASVLEVVLSGCINSMGIRPFYTSIEKRKANENMERLGILHLKKRSYMELSGGQMQRVLLARALCATKRLIVLDEPASGLDPYISSELYKLIAQVNIESGISIVMVSHDVERALQYSTKILHLQSGQEFFGDVNDYLNSEIGRKYLGRKAI